MGDRSRRDDLCQYCYCPCIEPGYSFTKYFKYLLPLLLLLWILFYPLGDPRAMCESDTACSSCGPMTRLMCSLYRYLDQLSIPEFPKLDSILEIPVLQRLSRATSFHDQCQDSNNQSSTENSIVQPETAPECSPEDQLDKTIDVDPENTTDCKKCSGLCSMFPGCSSNYLCRIKRPIRR